MRFRGSLLLEMGAVGAASIVAVAGAYRLGVAFAQVRGGGLTAVGAAALHPLDPPPVTIRSTTVGTFMGVNDDIALEHLRAQTIAEAKLNHGGSSISFRLTFSDGSRAAFKPLQTNPQTVPRKEVAAYRLNRLLGLTSVAPATMRTVHRDDLVGRLIQDGLAHWLRRVDAETLFDEEGFTRGEVSFWIPTIVDSKLDTKESIDQWTAWLTVGNELPADKAGLMAQLSSLVVFDMLDNNSDRFSGGNLMMSPDGQTLYYMDNTFGFQVEPEGHEKCRAALARVQKFSRRLVAQLRRLDVDRLRHALDSEPGVLRDDEMAAVVARAQVVLRHVDDLIALYGEPRVLVFP